MVNKTTMEFLAILILLIAMIFSSGCSGNYRVTYQRGNLSVSNDSPDDGCLSGHTNCSYHCVDLQNDDFNCGTCGKMCSGWGMICQNGSCSCAPGLAPCRNYCSDVSTDSYNCGSCGRICPVGLQCVNGQCGCAINQLTGVRMTNCENSCVDTSIDQDNCGACGRKCNFDEICLFGMCQRR